MTIGVYPSFPECRYRIARFDCEGAGLGRLPANQLFLFYIRHAYRVGDSIDIRRDCGYAVMVIESVRDIVTVA